MPVAGRLVEFGLAPQLGGAVAASPGLRCGKGPKRPAAVVSLVLLDHFDERPLLFLCRAGRASGSRPITAARGHNRAAAVRCADSASSDPRRPVARDPAGSSASRAHRRPRSPRLSLHGRRLIHTVASSRADPHVPLDCCNSNISARACFVSAESDFVTWASHSAKPAAA